MYNQIRLFVSKIGRFDLQKLQVKSTSRVRVNGKVLTARRKVKAILDFVKKESERIDSQILEPTCGDNNFLVAILKRNLKTVSAKYRDKKQILEFK